MLNKLRTTDTRNSSDIDLILEFLEEYLTKPINFTSLKQNSKRKIEFEIKRNPLNMTTGYQISWSVPDIIKV